jgi:hypothetical protein
VYGGGYYGKDGRWVQLKHCFVACRPERCNCQPPSGEYYCEEYDESKRDAPPGDKRMIAYKICWVHDGYEDSIILRGESIEELQEKAAKIIEERKPDDYWSEPA